MKLVHFADCHLGFRGYARMTANGLNQREADVAVAFSQVITRTIEIAPDAVVIAGDFFHAVRPTNPSILHAYKELARLVNVLPDLIIVMIAGNHDLPRTSETGCLLGLFKAFGIHVLTNEAARLSFRDGELSILCVPEGAARPKLDPDRNARYNVLLMHGEVEGLIRRHVLSTGARHNVVLNKTHSSTRARPIGDIALAEIGDPDWDYVALGHYHCYHQVAKNAFYSGSIEYTSTDIWSETAEDARSGAGGKGIIERDLATGAHTFHRIVSDRRVIDLPPLDAPGLTPEEVTEAIRARVDACPGGIDDQIVRLVVRDIEKHVIRDLDQRMIRGFKGRAMHFRFDARKPDEAIRALGVEAPRRHQPLADRLREFLGSRALTPGIDRSALVELGMHYLALAEEKEQRSAAVIEA